MRNETPGPSRSRLVLASLLVMLAVAPSLGRAATFIVTIGANGTTSFVDQASGTNTTTIHVSDTVQWNWSSGPHSTTSGTCQPGGGYYGGGGCTKDGNWDSGALPAQSHYEKVFNQQGNFPYYCMIHGSMMTAVVVVQAAAGPAPASDFRFQPTGPIVGTTVQFKDLSSGAPTSWSWDFGDGQGSNDQNPSHSYSAAGSYTVKLTATNAAGANVFSKAVVVTAGGPVACVADAFTHCLSNGRFRVTAQWTKPDSTSGPGNAVPLTPDSGYFWFFDATNIELITKVLNACGGNGYIWVFGAGLTNVKVVVDVLDTSTGVSEEYVNELNNPFQPIQDTKAFPTCP